MRNSRRLIGAIAAGTIAPLLLLAFYPYAAMAQSATTPTNYFQPAATLSSVSVYANLPTASSIVTTYQLKTSVQGQGTVSPSQGTYAIPRDQTVTVTATPSPGWVFKYWSWPGNTAGSTTWRENPTSWTMVEPISIIAVFEQSGVIPQAPANSPPVLAAIGNKTASVGSQIQFTVSASDPDGNALTYSSSGLPAGATFIPLTRTFTWTPTTAGTYAGITFQVSDGSLTDAESITITITTPPTTAGTMTTYQLKTSVQGQGTVSPSQGTYAIPRDQTVTVTATPSPGWAFKYWSWPGNTAGSTTWRENPTSWTMVEPISIIAVFERSGVIPQAPANSPPVLAAIGNKTASVGSQIQFTVSASDPDGNALTYSSSGLPAGATFIPLTRTFTWTPATAGTYAGITFQVSDGSLTDAESITITVTTPPTTAGTVTTYQLKTSVQGQGTVSPSQGTYAIPRDQTVTVTATPSPGWVFKYWSWPGNTAGSTTWRENPTSWTMVEPISIIAVFEQSGGVLAPLTPSGNRISMFYYGAFGDAIKARLLAAPPEFVVLNTPGGSYKSITRPTASEITELQGAGIKVLSYISTGNLVGFKYAADSPPNDRPFIRGSIESVAAEGCDGVFFDEGGVGYHPSLADRYLQAPALTIDGQPNSWAGYTIEDYASYAHSKGLIAVEGTDFRDPKYLNPDIFEIFDYVLTDENYAGRASDGSEVGYESQCWVINHGLADAAVAAAYTNVALGNKFGGAYATGTYGVLADWYETYRNLVH